MMRTHTRRTTQLGQRLLMLTLVASLLFFPGIIHWQPTGTLGKTDRVLADHANDYQEGVVVVELMPRSDPAEVAQRYSLELLDEIDGNFWLMGIPDERTVNDVIEQMRRDRDVKSVEPNYFLEVPVDQRTIIHIDGPGSGAASSNQAALEVIRAPQARALADGSGVVVAVIDTGVDQTHPDLTNLRAGYDFVDDDDDPSEVAGASLGHGTMVAGLITLVAPGVSIMPIRAFGPDGRGSTDEVAKAIRFAVQNGAEVINMSFGTVQHPKAIRGAINFAKHRAVLVASAGNDDTGALSQYPASDIKVMAVAATDLEDHKADFSNYGSSISVCAPGVGVISAYPGGGYASGNGTSFSTALVSGTLALALSAGSGDAVGAVEDSAVNIDELNPGFRGLLGHGRIDALAALSPGDTH